MRFTSFSLMAALAISICGCGASKIRNPSQSQSGQSAQGAVIYQTYCAACHQPDGGGGGDANIPPLAGSQWLRGPESRLVRIVLHGLRGPVKVRDATYNLEMLGFGQVLTDQQIASVLNHVRKQFGQVSPTEAAPAMISSQQVARIRAASADRSEYWTVEELLAVPR